MLTVAIAAEDGVFDAELYRQLLALSLCDEVKRWDNHNIIFNGFGAVMTLAPLFLRRAQRAGIRYALLATDNDGGPKHRPEHHESHSLVNEECRHCAVARTIPTWWSEEGRRQCVVVPVQTIETWLLFLRGDKFRHAPEQQYDRSKLKSSFYGEPLPPAKDRLAMALEQLSKPDALAKLRQRPSFVRYESQLAAWRVE